MNDPVAIYLKTIGLAPENLPVVDENSGTVGQQDQRYEARKAALARAHEIRQFEIELYWKRANYFWLLQASVFAAVGLTWKADAGSFPRIVPIGLASLGVLTACAGWLATYGSKFWQRNWEHHIDMLESEFEGDLYKTVFVSSSGIKWSLTGISEGLAACFFAFWIFVLLVVSMWANPDWTFKPHDFIWPPSQLEVFTLASWAITMVGILHLFKQGSGVKGAKVEYGSSLDFVAGATHKPRLTKDIAAKPFLVRREPKI